MSSVYIVGGDYAIQRMFEARGWGVVNNPDEADVLQFTGGADVSPHLYGEKPHHTTYSDVQRDVVEMSYYQAAQLLGKPCLGICRGGQFLNVMNGGKLWQNVNGHAIRGTHVAYVYPKEFSNKTQLLEEVQVTSTHHQMMRPADGAVLLVGANESTWLENDEGKFRADVQDIEAVYYDSTKSLCFQPHPEYGVKSCTDLYFQLIERTLSL